MRNLIFILFLLLPYLGSANPKYAHPDSVDTCINQHFEMIDSIISYGKQYMGVPYRYGGKSPKGFDCSGFVNYIFHPFGFNLPYSSKAYTNIGVEIDKSEAQKGDFALFKGRNASSSGVGHVALVVDVKEDGIYILHATINKGITIDNISTQDYYKKRYLSMRRMPHNCVNMEDILNTTEEVETQESETTN
jgi:cell wall-associated NlpC family hydrolase